MASSTPASEVVALDRAIPEDQLQAAAEMAARKRPLSRRLWLVGTVMVFVVGGYWFDRQASPVSRASVPYARQSVISTSSSGTALSPFDFETARPREGATPTATPTAAATPSPTSARAPYRPPSSRARHSIVSRSTDNDPTEVLVGMKDVAAALAAPVPTAPPALINVGARFEARFLTPVLTGAAPGIASAETTTDIVAADGRVVVPKGCRLEGEAVAVEESDRAQVAFKALVFGGKTIGIRGLVIGIDGQPGVAGKVLKKGSSKGKGLAGRLLGAAADVAGATGSLVTGLSFPQEVAGQLAQSATGDMKSLSAAWRRSDKVVQVMTGVTVQVYLTADVEIR